MVTCSNCGGAMSAAPMLGVVYDQCASCGGVFVEPEDAASAKIDIGLLFGGGPGSGNMLGPSERRCPRHQTPMTSFRVIAPTGPLTVERADCCGGVFLDPGEDSPLVAAAQRAARLASMATAEATPKDVVETASGARFAAPPSAKGGALGAALTGMSQMGAPRPSSVPPYRVAAGAPSERSCPRCRTGYRQDQSDGITVEVCPACGSMFLDAGDLDAKSIPTALLFGVNPHAAKPRGVSALRCPRCGDPMHVFEIAFIAGPIEIDRATCCGGLFLDGGEHEPFMRAARRAETDAADAHFSTHGEYVGEAAMIKGIAEGDGLSKFVVATIQSRVDAMTLQMIRDAQRRRDSQYYD